MADFEIADKITRSNEGGWQNDPHDTGNAPNGLGTYRGIASAKQPNWRGWPIIKAALANMTKQPAYGTEAYRAWVKTLNGILATNAGLQGLVVSFYRVNFWDVNRLGEFTYQPLANKLYDCGVNQGTGAAALMLQKCLGVMADGNIGPVTIRAANAADGPTLTQAFREARVARYRKLAADRPDQARYLDTWIARC